MMGVSVEIGQVIAGKYRVERVLGAGGMGMVVEVIHEELLQRMAIKLMLPEVAMSPELVDRFLREARTAAALKSQHATKVFDVGRLETGALYMVMEHLTGSDLTAVVKSRGALPAGEAALYVLQACEALAEAHRRGLVHRDIKPANLFLTRAADGSPCIKVLDFGVAKATAEASQTGTGALLGTPLYMSPEQVRGDRDIDARTDIWALGVVLYELVTGSVPFTGDSLWKIFKQVTDNDPAPPSSRRVDLPAGFDSLVLRCLEKDREKRPSSVVDLALLLAPYVPESARPLIERVERVQSARDEAEEIRVSGEPVPARGPVKMEPTLPASPALGFQKTELSHPGARVTGGGVTQTNAGAPARKTDRFVMIAGVVVGLVLAAVVGSLGWSRSSAPGVAASPPSRPAPEMPPLSPAPPVPTAPFVPRAPNAPLSTAASAQAQEGLLPPIVEPVLSPILPPAPPPPSGSVKPASAPAGKPTPGGKPASDRHNVNIP
jgi:serine/threonine-protein kinase